MLSATANRLSFLHLQAVPAAARRTTIHRWYSTSKQADKPLWPLYLSAAGVAGLGLYVYMEWGHKQDTNLRSAPQLESPLNPKEFLDFKLKRIEPYNHNTSK